MGAIFGSTNSMALQKVSFTSDEGIAELFKRFYPDRDCG